MSAGEERVEIPCLCYFQIFRQVMFFPSNRPCSITHMKIGSDPDLA